jgi:hypothetical protein
VTVDVLMCAANYCCCANNLQSSLTHSRTPSHTTSHIFHFYTHISPTHSLTHSPTHPLTHSHILTHHNTAPLCLSLSHSVTQSLFPVWQTPHTTLTRTKTTLPHSLTPPITLPLPPLLPHSHTHTLLCSSWTPAGVSVTWRGTRHPPRKTRTTSGTGSVDTLTDIFTYSLTYSHTH